MYPWVNRLRNDEGLLPHFRDDHGSALHGLYVGVERLEVARAASWVTFVPLHMNLAFPHI